MSSSAGDIRNTARWRAVSKAVIERDRVCAVCGTDEQLSADHIIPLSKGGEPYDMDNLTTLCMPHNRQKSNNTTGQISDYINPRWVEWERAA